VIAARAQLEEERQVFFLTSDGWDTHSSLKDLVDANLVKVDAALNAFEVEMKAQGVWQDIVLVTSSDFGRTYASNGAGTVRAAPTRACAHDGDMAASATDTRACAHDGGGLRRRRTAYTGASEGMPTPSVRMMCGHRTMHGEATTGRWAAP
jgi:hypothetical protein